MLKTVTIQDFRNIEDMCLDLDAGATFLFGANEAGKSSVIEAIRWALTGRARGTDAAGKGAGKLVRTGAKQATVTLEFDTTDGRVTLTRTVTASGKGHVEALGFDDELGATWTAEDVLLWLGAPDADVLDAALDGERLLSADHATAKALLLRLIQPAIVDEVDGRTYTVETIDAAEAAAREARLGLKRALQALGVPQKPRQPSVTAEDMAARRQAVSEAKAALLAHVRASDREAGRREELERRLAALGPGVDVAALEDELGDLRERIERTRAALETRPAPAEVEYARQFAEVAHRDLAAKQGQLEAVRAFSGGGHTCVLGAGIPCRTEAAAFVSGVAALEAEVRALAHGAEIADRTRDEWEAEAREADETERRLARWQSEAAALERRLERGKERAEVAAELAAFPESDNDVRYRLETAVTTASRALADAEEAARAWAHYREHATRAESLQIDLSACEARCVRLGPKGIRVAALASAVSDWLSVVNAHAARLGEHVLDLSLDPWRLVVDGRDAALLSASARLRVAIAVQIAMRAPIVLVDAADLLDEANVRAFTAWLNDIRTDRQAVITATRPAGARAPSWARAYWLESGRAQALAAARG
jgi:chromosome segregation ATPase